jgi:hypothetical protein
MPELDDDELLEALGVEAAPARAGRYTPREERLIAGFEDILRFHASHGRAPLHGEDRDIFERLYAVRLDRLLTSPEARALLGPLDTAGLLLRDAPLTANVDDLDDAALLAELGVDASTSDDITVLRHVGTFEDRRAAEEVANRTPCRDFERFKPLFERAEHDLKSGVRVARRFGRDARVAEGSFFILGGQIVYVAEMGTLTRTPNGEPDARLRVIYSNGTESDLLMRSLQRALYKDDTGRRLTEPDPGPLFGSDLEENDVVSGTIYVLRSKSDHPYVAAHRELIHKIGVTSGKVEMRIANALTDATYLLAAVEIASSYAVANLNSTKLENLIHRLFASAQLDLVIEDRFGNPVRPREWFLVPLHVIDEAVSRIRDGSIMDYEYSAAQARLVKVSAK